MKRIVTVIFLLTFCVNNLFSQKDTLFGVYRGELSFGYLNLKPDSTFDYLNDIDVGSRIKTTGNYHKIGDEILFRYSTKIYPELLAVKDSFDNKINNIKIKILFADSNGQVNTNLAFENKSLLIYHSKIKTVYSRLNDNGIVFLNDLQIDSIIILPAFCTPIIYPRLDKSKNHYEFIIRIPSPGTIYCLTYDKLYFDKGFLYFKSNKKGGFWYNSTLYKTRKSRKKISDMYNKDWENNKNSR